MKKSGTVAQFKHISLSIKQHIASVQLNRSPVNALNQEFVSELTHCAHSFKQNDDIWIVSVSSALEVFCAGADLKERATLSPSKVRSVVKNIQKMVSAWLDIPQPVIMKINGVALGGGLEFALAGDILFASESAVLGFPEVGLGIIPAAGGTQLLSRRTTMGTAQKWILTSNRFSALEAQSDGVVDIVVPASKMTEEYSRLLDSLSKQAPRALRQAKKAINGGLALTLKRALNFEQTCYEPLIATDDRKEALQSFIEKRKPIWRNT